MSEIDIEKVLEMRKETAVKLAKELWHGTIGEHVEQVLSRGETLSLDSLRESLLKAIERRKPDNVVRIRAETALEKLDNITPSRA